MPMKKTAAKPAKKTPEVKPVRTNAALVQQIRKKLRHLTHEQRPTKYLNLGSPKFNSIMGDPELGIFYGQMIELSGKNSHGKSAIAYDMAALAQGENSVIHWVDLERSFNAEWAATRGLRAEDVAIYEPFIGKFGSEREKRISTAEEVFKEVEVGIELVYESDPNCTQFIVVDSIAAILTEDEAEAGITAQGFVTSMSLPKMLNKLLKRWIVLMGEYNCIVLFLNQLRTKPMGFGDPDYTPGGNAMAFYAHSRVRIRRYKSGRMKNGGKVIGIKGILRNDKNKAGGVEGDEIGYKLYFSGVTKFLEAAALKSEEDSE